jgi:hypothetical protein
MDYITILCLINLVVTLYNILYSDHTDCYMEEMCNIHCNQHHAPHEHLLHFNINTVNEIQPDQWGQFVNIETL